MFGPESEDWWADAVCAQTDPELFFPAAGSAYSARQVIRVFCSKCPVMVECREFALESPDPPYGVWGGLTTRELALARRDRGKTVGPEAHLRRGA